MEWVGDQDATDTDGEARKLKVTYNDQDALAVSPDWQTQLTPASFIPSKGM